MPKRFSFPFDCPVVIDEPGVYRVSKLDDFSTLVEKLDEREQEREQELKTETISEVSI